MGEIFEGSEPAEKRAILNFLLQNPTVSGKTLEFTLRKPFEAVLELSHRPNLLRMLDRFRTADWGLVLADFDLIGLSSPLQQPLYA